MCIEWVFLMEITDILTAVGLFNAIINVILLIAVNWVVKKLNDGEGL